MFSSLLENFHLPKKKQKVKKEELNKRLEKQIKMYIKFVGKEKKCRKLMK